MRCWLRDDRAVVELTGRDRVRFLHGLTCNDVLKLATGRDGGSFGKNERVDLARTPSGRHQLNAATNRQGKMVALFSVLMLEDRLWLDLEAAARDALLAHLNAFLVMDDVTIADRRDLRVVRVEGVGDSPEIPRQETDEPGADWIVPETDVPRHRLAPGPAPDREARRIAWGWPAWGVDIDSTMTPMETGLDPVLISYTKGCYLGQEVIQRVKTYGEPPRKLVRLELDAPVAAGAQIDEGAGRITSSAGRFALAMVVKGRNAPGSELRAGGIRGIVRPLAI